MKILPVARIRILDQYTIQNEPVKPIDLMERASKAFAHWVTQRLNKNYPVKVFCGLGNNGGDGLAIARLLLEASYKVETYVVQYSDKSSADFQINFERLNKILPVKIINKPSDCPAIQPNELVIDAIFGSGLTRPVEGICKDVIQKINESHATVVSVDIASGLFADKRVKGEYIIQPDHTVSFQLPKLAFMIPENDKYVGEWHVVPIGLSQEFIDKADTQHFYVNTPWVQSICKPRTKFSHKGLFGHALIIGGSFGKMGAAVLNAKACMRSGVGLLTIHIPKCGYEILQTTVTEAMVSVDSSKKCFSELPDLAKYTSIGIGSGLAQHSKTIKAVEKLIAHAKCPVIFDADAINIIAAHPALLEKLPANSIFTPHLKEFERLTGKKGNCWERLSMQKEFSKKYKCYMILKGCYSAISTPEGFVYFNSTGNAGMATAGSGDVLTGILTGLLAQNYTPLEACILGTYLHGLAGDIAAERYSEESLIATDIINCLGEAFKHIHPLKV